MDGNELIKKLYSENKGKLTFYIKSQIFSNSFNDAEDCLQETFVIALRKAKTEDIRLHPNKEGWLFSIAKNVARKFNANYVNIIKNSVGLSEIDYLKYQEDFSNQFIEDDIYHNVDLDYFKHSLAKTDRDLFELKHEENLSFKEVSVILNKNEGALRMKWLRIKQKFKNFIKTL